MKVLLVAATEMEIAPAIELFNKSGFVYSGTEVNILITGVGQVATTWMLANALHTMRPQLAIQAGIAGAFDARMLLGSVAYVQKDCFGDLGMEEDGHFSTIFSNGFANADEVPFTAGWMINNNPPVMSKGLKGVSAVSINKVTDSMIQRQQLTHQFNPDIETMEGAAFHYVCLRAGIPFVQIRAISNYVGERDKTKWKRQEAIGNLNDTLLQLIETIDQ
jgi:futalosine hydrolase